MNLATMCIIGIGMVYIGTAIVVVGIAFRTFNQYKPSRDVDKDSTIQKEQTFSCKLGFHDWKYFDGGYNTKTEWRICKTCGKAEAHTQFSVIDGWEEASLDDIDQHSICPECRSENIYYCPQFTYDKKYKIERVAGIRECLDCGSTGSVV